MTTRHRHSAWILDATCIVLVVVGLLMLSWSIGVRNPLLMLGGAVTMFFAGGMGVHASLIRQGKLL